MRFVYNRLRGRIVEKYGSQQAFARDLGIAEITLSQKLSNKTEFKCSEINRTCELLGIGKDEIGDYFFEAKVEKSLL